MGSCGAFNKKNVKRRNLCQRLSFSSLKERNTSRWPLVEYRCTGLKDVARIAGPRLTHHYSLVWKSGVNIFFTMSSWPANEIDWLPTSCPNLADSCGQMQLGDCWGGVCSHRRRIVYWDVLKCSKRWWRGGYDQLLYTTVVGFFSYPLAICDILKPKMPKRKPVSFAIHTALLLWRSLFMYSLFFSSFKSSTNVYRMGSIMMSWVSWQVIIGGRYFPLNINNPLENE